MKRITVLTISLLILLLASFATSPAVVGSDIARSDNQSMDIGIDQEGDSSDSYYPIFNGISVDAQHPTNNEIRNRNETRGEGAIVQVDSYTNVTFNYVIALQNTSILDNTIDLRLFADLPRVNTSNFNTTFNPIVSLTDSSDTLDIVYQNQNSSVLDYTHPETGVVIDNATLYEFSTSVVLNMTTEYLPFYALELTNDLGEDKNNGAHNLLTVDDYFNTSSQDEFYIQQELVNITGNLYFDTFDNQNELGIDYRLNSGAITSENFSLTLDANNGSDMLTFDAYEPGDVFFWDSVYYVANDTAVNQSRIISNIDSKQVEIGDGSPSISVEIDTNHELGQIQGNAIYSANNLITFTVVTSVPKGNITTVNLNATESDTVGFDFAQVNGTFGDVDLIRNVTFSDEGQFETTIVATTDKGLTVNETYTVYIDSTSSTITALALAGTSSGGTLVTSDGTVTFNFGFNDENSGVMLAVLELGNGESLEVTDLNSIEHRYEDFDGVTFTITLTVIDFAGNSISSSESFTLQGDELEETSAPSLAIYIFVIALLALLTSFWWGPKVSERLFN